MVSLWQKESCKFVRKILSTIMRGSGTAQVSFGELLRLVRGGDVPLQIEMPTPLHSSPPPPTPTLAILSRLDLKINGSHEITTTHLRRRLLLSSRPPLSFPRKGGRGIKRNAVIQSEEFQKATRDQISRSLWLKFTGRDILFSRFLSLHTFPPR